MRTGTALAPMLAAAAAFGAPPPARAGNDDALLHGADAAMTAGAVTATTEDGASAYYNPAGIAHVGRTQVNVSASAVVLQRLEIRDFLSSTTGESVDEDVLVIPFIPAAVTFAGTLGPRVSYGGGIFVSQQFAYTVRASLDTASPRPFNFTLAVEQREINTVPGLGLGVDVTPQLRVGLAIFGRYREQYGSTVFGAGTVEGAAAPLVIAQSASFGSQGAGLEARLGVQWEPIPELHLAAALWTPTFNVFTATQQTDTTTLAAATPGEEPVVGFFPEESDTTRWGFEQVSSWRVRAGAAWRAPWGWVSLDGDVSTAFRDVEVGVDRGVSWNLRAGAKVALDDVVSVGVGLFTDRAATADDADILLAPRVSLYGGTVGVTYDDAHRLDRGERARDIRFMTGFALRLAYGRGEFGTLRFDPRAGQLDAFLTAQESDASIFEAALYLASGLYF